MSDVEILRADARRVPLADETVQCVVTSPPYWGLRKYSGEQELIWRNPQFRSALECEHEWGEESHAGGGPVDGKERWNHTGHGEHGHATATTNTCTCCGAWRGGFGLEPTIALYIEHTLEILREIRRVLRPDGVVFWNIGDSYATGAGSARRAGGNAFGKTNAIVDSGDFPASQPNRMPQDGLKPKDLSLIPARVAIAAQADGWWVRSMVVWAKPNPMPESVTDRPTDAYEHVIMLTKSERYFWDADAVREKAVTDDMRRPYTSEGAWEMDGRPIEQRHGGELRSGLAAFGHESVGTHSRGKGKGGPKQLEREAEGVYANWADSTREIVTSRNLRNVWVFPTQPYKGSHFATFPEEIPRRCILAATSARGACRFCGAPWQRVVQRSQGAADFPSGWHQSGSGRWKPEHVERFGTEYDGKWQDEEPDASGRRMLKNLKASREAGYGDTFAPRNTIGWRPTCLCKNQRGAVRPCVVLDPFAGSGTTGRVAIELNRRGILLDLAYHDHAGRRTRNVQRRLPI